MTDFNGTAVSNAPSTEVTIPAIKTTHSSIIQRLSVLGHKIGAAFHKAMGFVDADEPEVEDFVRDINPGAAAAMAFVKRVLDQLDVLEQTLPNKPGVGGTLVLTAELVDEYRSVKAQAINYESTL